MSQASAACQRLIKLEDEAIFYAALNFVVADEAKWDFILYLAGYPINLPSRFQIDPLLLENLKWLYERITKDSTDGESQP